MYLFFLIIFHILQRILHGKPQHSEVWLLQVRRVYFEQTVAADWSVAEKPIELINRQRLTLQISSETFARLQRCRKGSS